MPDSHITALLNVPQLEPCKVMQARERAVLLVPLHRLHYRPCKAQADESNAYRALFASYLERLSDWAVAGRTRILDDLLGSDSKR